MTTWRRPTGSGYSHLFATERGLGHAWVAECGYDLRPTFLWAGRGKTHASVPNDPESNTAPHTGRERSKCPRCVAAEPAARGNR